ncbi:hypothetical protein AGMMS50267_13810 [Spirochaetia bacterium]|nr:hypothetical protein AGMMS50267_13810 [Spirochaetia bacterium]
MRSVYLLSVMFLSICVVVSTCRLDSAVEPVDPNLDTELAAWEAQGVTCYLLTITHSNGDATYSTKAIITENVPEYVGAGDVGIVGASEPVLLPDEFPFQPIAETVRDIYDIVEKAVSNNTLAAIQFDSVRHIPKYVKIANDTLVITNFDPVTNSKQIGTGDFDMTLFNQEKAAWEAQNIRSYRFVERTDLNFQSIPIQITVLPGTEPILECPSDFPADQFAQADLEAGTLCGKTISEIYSEIEKRVASSYGWCSQDSAHRTVQFTIRYNAAYHYPEYFHNVGLVDGNVEPGGWGGIEITSFEPLDE